MLLLRSHNAPLIAASVFFNCEDLAVRRRSDPPYAPDRPRPHPPWPRPHPGEGRVHAARWERQGSGSPRHRSCRARGRAFGPRCARCGDDQRQYGSRSCGGMRSAGTSPRGHDVRREQPPASPDARSTRSRSYFGAADRRSTGASHRGGRRRGRCCGGAYRGRSGRLLRQPVPRAGVYARPPRNDRARNLGAILRPGRRLGGRRRDGCNLPRGGGSTAGAQSARDLRRCRTRGMSPFGGIADHEAPPPHPGYELRERTPALGW